jgi:hypothetical protein
MYFLQTGILMMISMQVDALAANLSEHGAPLNDLPIEDTHARQDSCEITGESNDNKKPLDTIVIDSSSAGSSPVKIDAQPIKTLPIENAGTLGVSTDTPAPIDQLESVPIPRENTAIHTVRTRWLAMLTSATIRYNFDACSLQ